jgi:hypothetical protein
LTIDFTIEVLGMNMSSYYITLSFIDSMWDVVIEVLGIVEDGARQEVMFINWRHLALCVHHEDGVKTISYDNDFSFLLHKKD